MIRRLAGVSLLCAGVAAGVTLAGQGRPAQDPVKGAALVAEARKALGGDRLAEVKRLQANGTIRRGAGNVNLEGDLEVFVELPNRFRRDETLVIDPAGQEVQRKEVLVGAESWEETRRGGGVVNFGDGGDFGGGGDAGGGDGRREGGSPVGGGQPGQAPAGRGGPQVSPEAQHQARQTEFARILLALLLTADTPINWIGTAKSPDGEADVVEIKTADGSATRLLLDSKTHMPLMLTWTGVPQDAFAALVGRAGFRGRGSRGGRGGFGRGGDGGFRGRGAQGGEPAAGGDPGPGGRGRGALEPTTLQMFLSDYRTVNGIRLPHLMTRGANDEITEEWIVRNYRINPNFRADTFSK